MEKRRGTVRPHAAAGLIAALALGWTLVPASGCELPAGKRLESARLSLSYRTVPARIAPGEHFEVFFALCSKGGFKPTGVVKVDAGMPEHRHGMNYRPTVIPVAGEFRSQGWMFHMPGRWEIVFEVEGERLTDSVQIE